LSDLLHIKRIYLSLFDQGERENVDEGVSDVIVTMQNQTKYLAVFYTSDYLQKWLVSAKLQARLYHCMPSFVLVQKLDRESIKIVVEKMIDRGDFQLYFTKLN